MYVYVCTCLHVLPLDRTWDGDKKKKGGSVLLFGCCTYRPGFPDSDISNQTCMHFLGGFAAGMVPDPPSQLFQHLCWWRGMAGMGCDFPSFPQHSHDPLAPPFPTPTTYPFPNLPPRRDKTLLPLAKHFFFLFLPPHLFLVGRFVFVGSGEDICGVDVDILPSSPSPSSRRLPYITIAGQCCSDGWA